MRVQSRTLADVSEIERTGEDRFHRAGSRIIGVPLDRHAGSQPLFEPSFALPSQSMCDHTLGMCDVRKMSETDRCFVLSQNELGQTEDKQTENKNIFFHENGI